MMSFIYLDCFIVILSVDFALLFFYMFVLISFMIAFRWVEEHGISFLLFEFLYFVGGTHYTSVKSYCRYVGQSSV